MRKLLGNRMKVAAVRTLQAMTLIALLSAPLSHAQFMAQACAPINNISWRDQGELQAIPVIWSPGHTYTVSLIGAFSITSLLGSDCPDIAVSEWEWPDYPNYDEIGPPAQYIHLSNLTYVSSTLTTFTASVDGGAPFGYVELMLKSSSEGYAFWGVAIEPPAPPTPPSPPLPPPPPPPPAPCPTPAFAPVSPNTPVSPSVWFAGKTYPIVITGTGFTTPANATDSCPATQITVSVDTGSVALSDVTVLNSTTITATAEPADTDPAETAEVNLWGPGGGGIVLDARTAGNAKQAASSARAMASSPPVGPDGMALDGQGPAQISTCPTPSITSISPDTWLAGKTYNSVVMTGTNFITLANATKDCSTWVSATSSSNKVFVTQFTVTSPTSITATINSFADDRNEPVIVSVTNSSHSASTKGKIIGCQIPAYETETFLAWTTDWEGVWTVTPQNPNDINYAGVNVQEQNAGNNDPSADKCYSKDPHANVVPFYQLTGVGEDFLVQSPLPSIPASWYDYVGWSEKSVEVYRARGAAPCGTSMHQQMGMMCLDDQDDEYHFQRYGSINLLLDSFTDTTVTSSRAGQPQTKEFK